MTRALFSRRWLPITLMVFLVVGVSVRLGFWQLDRLSQRRAANAVVAHAASLPVVALPTSENVESEEYRMVTARGRYDFTGQLGLRNQAKAGEYGYHLLTPMHLVGEDGQDLNVAVLVDRGWIPATGNASPEDWRKFDVAGVVEITGVVRLSASPHVAFGSAESSTMAAALQDQFVRTVSPAAISAQLGYQLLPYYLQAVNVGGSSDLPSADIALPELSNGPHLGYAIQWFGFAIAALVGYATYVRRHDVGTE